MNQDLIAKVATLKESGGLLPSAAKNMETWLEGGFLSETSLSSIAELLDAGNADELNNRFYREIAFGTGGMRGRTIGLTATELEKGDMDASGSPANPGVGSNMLNEYTVVRATLGLFAYAKAHHDREGIEAAPKFVIAHDVRHFSRFFCELAASVWAKKGGDAFIFEGPRSTPQLSFSVRHLGATCGVVITASHNPPHDNGFKAYFSDGGQMVPPNDTGVIDQVNAIPLEGLQEFIEVDLSNVTVLGADLDEAYNQCVANCVIDQDVFKKTDLRAVFTPIHGTGAVATLPALQKLGLDPLVVEEQRAFDSNFPTVKSPNPENSEALALATKLAEANDCDLLMATDPDADRMGVAVKGPDGKMVLLTGNQIGSIMAEYRISKLKEMGWIPQEGGDNCALVKTFVTSPLQDAIATSHGIKVVNTLTGFKWIGEKLRIYQGEACEKSGVSDYDSLSLKERAELLQQHSTFYVFGGEESYGYLPNDTVRDKDANAACALFCEIGASLKAQGTSMLEYLDAIYLKNGYFLEGLGQLVYEGAAGAAKIARILETYRSTPPTEFLGSKVSKFTDFGIETVLDPDGKEVPKQDLYFVELENGYRYAVRGSGTEPKIKFYIFAKGDVASADELEATKGKTKETLEELKQAILDDAGERAES
ncbi:phospho-sugar mutase [Pelagicoccus sp. SDUM812002]|uniref:phospho-sugar mutase n=1 Tax=Pelagicoccus sp. SDUM812002 TaxID=3041266 RepID=UPI0028102042|nr:phospho-sugar mutase [Pelagicoccus sp. SDUM812002]MDQ8185556.1 phospho-sugar mutase [Pelagicoccus sp. SDUM812002]